MKRTLLLTICTLFALCSCNTKESKTINAKSAIQDYLNEKIPGAEVTEIIRVDSAYSPFLPVMSLSLQMASYYSDISRKALELVESETRKQFNERKDSAIAMIKEENFIDDISKIMDEMKEPFDKDYKDVIGVQASYTLSNGTSITDYFFYNRNEPTIGHTQNMLFDRLGDCLKTLQNIREVQSDIRKEQFWQ